MTCSPAATGRSPQRPYAPLAEHLVALRRAARLPQRVLAEAANVSRGAVQRAESGTAAPTLTVLDAYLRACRAGEADRARARLLRARGRTAQRARLDELKAPAVGLITTRRDFALALAEVYERAGAPSLGDARLTRGRTPLPRTTAWRIVNRKGLPASAEQLITFLTACGVRPAAQRRYLDAYRHVIAQRGAHPAPPRARLIRRVHPVPLAHGGTDTDAGYDLTALAASLTVLADAVPRVDVSAAAPALKALAENVAAVGRLVNRDAHRNGTAAPAWTASLSHIGTALQHALADSTFTAGTDDRGIDLVTLTGNGSPTVYQATSHRDRPSPSSPARPGAPAPPPPVRPAAGSA